MNKSLEWFTQTYTGWMEPHLYGKPLYQAYLKVDGVYGNSKLSYAEHQKYRSSWFFTKTEAIRELMKKGTLSNEEANDLLKKI